MNNAGIVSQHSDIMNSITIRPIDPSDRKIEASFVKGLSAETKHNRFFGGVNELSEDMLDKLCVVDGKSTMAFIATVVENGREFEVGVCRYVPGDQKQSREMAVTIADAWQSTDLGVLLSKRLISYAQQKGVTKIYAVELACNAYMRELAQTLKMEVVADPEDPHQVIYSRNI